MTKRSRGGPAADEPSRADSDADGGADCSAVRHTDEIFEALAAGRPISSEDETSRLLRALVADVGLDAPAMFPLVPVAWSWAEAAPRREGSPARRPPRPVQPRIKESRGPLRCR